MSAILHIITAFEITKCHTAEIGKPLTLQENAEFCNKLPSDKLTVVLLETFDQCWKNELHFVYKLFVDKSMVSDGLDTNVTHFRSFY